VAEFGFISFTLSQEQTDSYPNQIYIGLRNQVVGSSQGVGTLSFPITQFNYLLSGGLPLKPTIWQVFVTLNGVDVTVNLTGRVLIEAEEGTAKIASFSLKPAVGILDLSQWVDKLVVISFSHDADSAVFTLYKGYVDTPVYNPVSRVVSFSCTDKLQRFFDDRTKEQILLNLGGSWSEHIFEETNDHWQYAQDVLSTVPKSVDLSIDLTMDVTEWQAKPVADFTYVEKCIVDESLSVEIANAREIINHVTVSFSYQYRAFKELKVKSSWARNPSIPSTLWLTDPSSEISNKMVVEAHENAGWQLSKPFKGLTPLPVTQTFLINGNPFIFGNNYPEALVGFSLFMAKRYIQNVTESTELVVKSPASITALGEIKDRASYGMSAQYSEDIDSEFLSTKEKTYSYLSNTGSLTFKKYASFDYRGYEAFNGQKSNEGIQAVTGTTLFTADNLILEGNRSESDLAYRVATLTHVNQILQTHRQTRVEFTTVLNPLLNRPQTIAVDTLPVKARGKVYSYRHQIDIAAGSAFSEISLAISREYGLGIPDVETPPAQSLPTPAIVPVDTPTDLQWGNYIEGFSGPIGSKTGFNEFGKTTTTAGTTETSFDVQSREIPEESTQTLLSEGVKEYIVAVPIDLLILEV
jgi:hypothetical protein